MSNMLSNRDRSEQPVMSIQELSRRTCLTPDDVASTLDFLGFLIKNPRTNTFEIHVNLGVVKEYLAKVQGKIRLANPSHLRWMPFGQKFTGIGGNSSNDENKIVDVENSQEETDEAVGEGEGEGGEEKEKEKEAEAEKKDGAEEEEN